VGVLVRRWVWIGVHPVINRVDVPLRLRGVSARNIVTPRLFFVLALGRPNGVV